MGEEPGQAKFLVGQPQLAGECGCHAEEDAIAQETHGAAHPEGEMRLKYMSGSRALDACRARRCLVIVDGEPVEDLGQEVVLRPDSRVQFLRLVPLQGG